MTRSTLVGLALLACACSNDAPARHLGGAYDGNGSVVATVDGAPSGLVGATAVHVLIDDNGFVEEKGTMTIALAPDCSLAADYVSVDTGAATASIASAQTCKLPVDDGFVVFTVASGHASVSAGNALDLTLAGTLTSWQGETKQGSVSFTFRGASSGPG